MTRVVQSCLKTQALFPDDHPQSSNVSFIPSLISASSIRSSTGSLVLSVTAANTAEGLAGEFAMLWKVILRKLNGCRESIAGKPPLNVFDFGDIGPKRSDGKGACVYSGRRSEVTVFEGNDGPFCGGRDRDEMSRRKAGRQWCTPKSRGIHRALAEDDEGWVEG